jgi:hypothetical protein
VSLVDLLDPANLGALAALIIAGETLVFIFSIRTRYLRWTPPALIVTGIAGACALELRRLTLMVAPFNEAPDQVIRTPIPMIAGYAVVLTATVFYAVFWFRRNQNALCAFWALVSAMFLVAGGYATSLRWDPAMGIWVAGYVFLAIAVVVMLPTGIYELVRRRQAPIEEAAAQATTAARSR